MKARCLLFVLLPLLLLGFAWKVQQRRQENVAYVLWNRYGSNYMMQNTIPSIVTPPSQGSNVLLQVTHFRDEGQGLQWIVDTKGKVQDVYLSTSLASNALPFTSLSEEDVRKVHSLLPNLPVPDQHKRIALNRLLILNFYKEGNAKEQWVTYLYDRDALPINVLDLCQLINFDL